MPQLKVLRETDKSLNPDFTKLITSFLLDLGKIKSGFSSYNFKSFSVYLDNLKKYDSSSIHSTGPPVTVLKESSFCLIRSFSL